MHKVIYLAVGEEPEVREVAKLDEEAMRALVDGPVEMIALAPGIDMWVNKEAVFRDVNRFVPIWGGGFAQVHGPVFVATVDENGDSIGLTSEQLEEWLEDSKAWDTTNQGKYQRRD